VTKSQKNPTAGTSRREFDQAKHWQQRGENYRSEIEQSGDTMHETFRRQEDEFREILASLPLDGVESVLEIGCGYGRMTPLLLDALPKASRYHCLDISRGQVAAARHNLQSHPGRDRVDYVVADISASPLRVSYDLVVTIEVLLHFPPDEVAAVLHAMQRAANRFLIHIDPFEAVKEPAIRVLASRLRDLGRWATGKRQQGWLHPFPTLYQQDRLASVEQFPVLGGGQHVFVVEMEQHHAE